MVANLKQSNTFTYTSLITFHRRIYDKQISTCLRILYWSRKFDSVHVVYWIILTDKTIAEYKIDKVKINRWIFRIENEFSVC